MNKAFVFLLVLVLLFAGGTVVADSGRVLEFEEGHPLYGKTPVVIGDDEFVVLESGDTAYFLCVVAPGSGNSWKVESFGLEAGAIHCSPITGSRK